MDNSEHHQPCPCVWCEVERQNTEADYEAALARIDVLMDSDPISTSPAGEELGLLCLLVGSYEAAYYPMGGVR